MRIETITLPIEGHELTLRNPQESDAELLLDYLRTTSAETPFLLREPEEVTMTPEEERAFIARQNDCEGDLMLLGFLDGQFVGNCSLHGMPFRRYRHRAEVAIALYQRFTGMGLGRRMLEQLILCAKQMGYEQLELEVAAANKGALALYQKLGFEIYGKFPDNLKYSDGSYDDIYWMMRRL